MNTWFRVLHYFFKAEDFGPEYSSALFCFCCSAQLGAQTLLCHLLFVAQGKAQLFDGFFSTSAHNSFGFHSQNTSLEIEILKIL